MMMSGVDALAPQLTVSGTLLGVLALGSLRLTSAAALRWLAVAALAAAAALLPAYGSFFGTAAAWDAPALLWTPLFLLGAIPLAAVHRSESEVPLALVLACVLGMTLIAVARSTPGLFLGLELMSLPAYLLVYTLRRSPASLEAAVKYFFAGGVAGALFVLGAALSYTATGTLEIVPATSGPAVLGLALMAAAALFKLGAVPLHFWLPDAYEAARPELAGFLSTSMKAAAALLLIRVAAALDPLSPVITALVPIAGVTMVFGNLLALRQTSLQRLLAYSSIAHAGYILLGIAAWARLGGTTTGLAPVWLYLASYLAMNTGAFLLLRLNGLTEVRQLKGFGAARPWSAALLALMLVALAGLPPTAGFLAKLFVFWDAVKAGLLGLVLIAAASTLVGLGYYFRLIRSMYFDEAEGAPPEPEPAAGGRALLILCSVPTVLVGLFPAVLDWVKEALSR